MIFVAEKNVEDGSLYDTMQKEVFSCTVLF